MKGLSNSNETGGENRADIPGFGVTESDMSVVMLKMTVNFIAASVYIRDPNGCELAYIQLIADFTAALVDEAAGEKVTWGRDNIDFAKTKSAAVINYHLTDADSKIPQITFSGNKSRGMENATD